MKWWTQDENLGNRTTYLVVFLTSCNLRLYRNYKLKRKKPRAGSLWNDQRSSIQFSPKAFLWPFESGGREKQIPFWVFIIWITLSLIWLRAPGISCRAVTASCRNRWRWTCAWASWVLTAWDVECVWASDSVPSASTARGCCHAQHTEDSGLPEMTLFLVADFMNPLPV